MDEIAGKKYLQKLTFELRKKTVESIDKLLAQTNTNLSNLLATELFLPKRTFVETAAKEYLESYPSAEKRAEKVEAEQDLLSWEKSSGKPSVYTPIELANARLKQKIINRASELHSLELELLNAMHQAYISVAIKQELSAKMIEEGKVGKKFGLIELTSRLGPTLTFPDSSNYFHIAAVPYGKESRITLGEAKTKEFVSADVAKESCANLLRTFNVDYAVAETSAAPRSTVPKSKRLPEVYICSVKKNKIDSANNNANTEIDKTTNAEQIFFESHHTINTPFREEFNAVVQELLFYELAKLYRG